MAAFDLHRAVRRGNLPRIRELLQDSPELVDLDARDSAGWTPLRYAVASPRPGTELVRLLLSHGATLDHAVDLPAALACGDPQRIVVLLQAGADIRYTRAKGYDALIDAVHGRDIVNDPHLLELLGVLIGSGVSLNGVSDYGESGLRVLSRAGRFDAVKLLLDAGASGQSLQFTSLISAVAFGSVQDVEVIISSGADLEQREFWERTAWLVAIQTGEVSKALLLRQSGANVHARGRCGTPPLFYAISNGRSSMLQWLIAQGADIEEMDEFGNTSLITAVGYCSTESVTALLEAGADVDRRGSTETALSNATTRNIVMQLLEAGADPSELKSEGHRALLGYPANSDKDLLNVSLGQFRHGSRPRLGTHNPTKMRVSFWTGMVRSGLSAYQARTALGITREGSAAPVWCAQRFGQSITLLADGRIVQIGGEHEDYYDEDFCIYNDVIVHDASRNITIYGYPEAVFPATDSHSATLIGNHIYVIGSLGYPRARHVGETPVYRLDTDTFEMHLVETTGERPGWIYGHRATHVLPHEIRVTGGKVVTPVSSGETHLENSRVFSLDVSDMVWRGGEPAVSAR